MNSTEIDADVMGRRRHTITNPNSLQFMTQLVHLEGRSLSQDDLYVLKDKISALDHIMKKKPDHLQKVIFMADNVHKKIENEEKKEIEFKKNQFEQEEFSLVASGKVNDPNDSETNSMSKHLRRRVSFVPDVTIAGYEKNSEQTATIQKTSSHELPKFLIAKGVLPGSRRSSHPETKTESKQPDGRQRKVSSGKARIETSKIVTNEETDSALKIVSLFKHDRMSVLNHEQKDSKSLEVLRGPTERSLTNTNSTNSGFIVLKKPTDGSVPRNDKLENDFFPRREDQIEHWNNEKPKEDQSAAENIEIGSGKRLDRQDPEKFQANLGIFPNEEEMEDTKKKEIDSQTPQKETEARMAPVMELGIVDPENTTTSQGPENNGTNYQEPAIGKDAGQPEPGNVEAEPQNRIDNTREKFPQNLQLNMPDMPEKTESKVPEINDNDPLHGLNAMEPEVDALETKISPEIQRSESRDPNTEKAEIEFDQLGPKALEANLERPSLPPKTHDSNVSPEKPINMSITSISEEPELKLANRNCNEFTKPERDRSLSRSRIPRRTSNQSIKSLDQSRDSSYPPKTSTPVFRPQIAPMTLERTLTQNKIQRHPRSSASKSQPGTDNTNVSELPKMIAREKKMPETSNNEDPEVTESDIAPDSEENVEADPGIRKRYLDSITTDNIQELKRPKNRSNSSKNEILKPQTVDRATSAIFAAVSKNEMTQTDFDKVMSEVSQTGKTRDNFSMPLKENGSTQTIAWRGIVRSNTVVKKDFESKKTQTETDNPVQIVVQEEPKKESVEKNEGTEPTETCDVSVTANMLPSKTNQRTQTERTKQPTIDYGKFFCSQES